MPEELTEDDERLSAKANVASVKTSFLKKGLARQKNLLAARKKEAVGKNLQPPEELITFLNDEATLGEVQQIENKQDILVRRYNCLSLHIFACRSRSHCPCYLQIPHVSHCVYQLSKRGCCHEYDGIRGHGCDQL